MRGLKSFDLVAMVDFLYCGEANVYQENLDSFLAIAEELQLKGLQASNDQNELNERDLQRDPLPIKPKQKYGTDQIVRSEVRKEESNALAIPFSGDLLKLDEIIKSMMETSQNMFQNGNKQIQGKQCKVCGKEGRATDIMRHIEAHHLEGVSIPCNHCDKIFRSRDNLRCHVSKQHRQH